MDELIKNLDIFFHLEAQMYQKNNDEGEETELSALWKEALMDGKETLPDGFHDI